MKHIQLSLTLNPCNETVTDILSYQLGEIGYDSFITTDQGLDAYISILNFSEKKLEDLLQHLLIDAEADYEFNVLEDKDWNKEWERNYFPPLIISDKCLVRSSFHEVGKQFTYEIIIDPKMAFGTGHHQTTSLMLQEILQMDLKNKSLLDMGCGTAVLAILASKMGATPIVAIDIDEWAYENAKENIVLNNIANVEVKLGDATVIGNNKFDFIFANINRNILLQDMATYAEALEKRGVLMMSGFYLKDVPIIKLECEKNRLHFQKIEQKDNWTMMVSSKL
ncbi:MAG: 50S ribosomal protein L11 methyltransferase [Dysgonamonadaceae bacterium]|nr:50S ribosomal protein L11 methyltransferase [Dysgonamonadaceae bacterium]